jgi:flagellar biosynthetic protein FliP
MKYSGILLLLLTVLSGMMAAVEPPALDLPDPEMTAPDAVVTSAELTDATGKDPSATAAAVPMLSTNLGGLTVSVASPTGKQGMSSAVSLLLVITVLSIAPAFLMMMTSFTRIIIVLGFLRRALGTQTLPPNQVMVGLALFLTLFVMAPTFNRINSQAVQPYLKEQITQEQAIEQAKAAARDFMAKQTRKADLALFIRLAKEERPATIADVSFTALVPAFITSELKTAFQMGFIIFLPFLVIDLVVSAVLMALGMMMLPPVVVSLPFKILLFVLVDGWTLLMQSLVASYGM